MKLFTGQKAIGAETPETGGRLTFYRSVEARGQDLDILKKWTKIYWGGWGQGSKIFNGGGEWGSGKWGGQPGGLWDTVPWE